MGALEVAAAVRRGEGSAAEAVEAALAAIERRDGELHAFNTVTVDEARAAAADVDRRVAAGEDP
jgi:aspartyl-tRNA(Asn)/glutamyl-tRNA(Gln) amidotransferase subunit A